MKPKPVMMKGMMAERAVYKLTSEAAVISEGHASGGQAYRAEAQSSCQSDSRQAHRVKLFAET